MFPIRLDRDTNLIPWQAFGPAWCTTHQIITASNQVRSNGVLNLDYGVLDNNAATGAILASKATFMGLHMAAPEEDAGFTCYQITARLMCDDGSLKPILIVGEAQTVTADAGGDEVKETRLLDVASFHSSSVGGMMKTDMTIAMSTMPTAGKNPCFALGILNGLGTSGNLNAWGHLAVRRLVGVNPAILDTGKLG